MAIGHLKRRILFLHALFWCVYATFFIYQINRKQDRELGELLSDAGFQVFSMMLIAYVNYFIFFARFLKHRNVWRYILEFALPFALLIWATIYGKRWMAQGYDDASRFHFLHSQRFTVYYVVSTLFLVLFVAMLRFVEDWLELEHRRKELEHEKLTAELQFLKAQINPHFLFNTLNNLYYLAFTQSPNTPEVVAKLAHMMRYMIYDSNHALVSLQKEIEYMENYIALEQLRLNHEANVRFEVNGAIEMVKVPPLILITFLENAFKHGLGPKMKNGRVYVKLEVQGKQLHYWVENSVPPASSQEGQLEKSGIGLQNTLRRLALTYPDRHRLSVHQTPDTYQIQLTLDLL